MNPNIRPIYRTSDRFVGGGFLGPFILGGITGGLISPLFNNGYNRPIYYQPYPVYPYYPCPYCR